LWQAALLAAGAALFLATGWYAAEAYLGGEVASALACLVFLVRASRLPEIPRERIFLVTAGNFAARAAILLLGLTIVHVRTPAGALAYLFGYFSLQGVFWRWSLSLGEDQRPVRVLAEAGVLAEATKEDW